MPHIPSRDKLLCSGILVNVSDRVREVLNLPSKLPKDLKGEFIVDGRRVVIYPSSQTPTHRSGRGTNRIYITNNEGRLVPAGRLKQAVCNKGKKGSRKS